MEQDLFKFLPSDIINDILLRLPVRSIAISKCVCKPWLHLLQSDEFLQSHLSRSSECLAVSMKEDESSRCSVYELEEEIDADSSRDRRHNPLTTLDFHLAKAVLGSANGLLLLHFDDFYSGALYVCNPISREYIELNCPERFLEKVCLDYWGCLTVSYGFGVSKVSGQYKVVRIIDFDDHCHVYTLGTASTWRRVEAAHDLTSFHYGYRDPGAIVNGSLHWLVQDLVDYRWLISCFDLETECFSTFSHPPVVTSSTREIDRVFALRDCLCWCDQTLLEDGVTVDIWLMKEYGVEKSWTKEYVINFNPDFDMTPLNCLIPIKVFKDGGILMQWGHDFLFYYSDKSKTTQKYGGPKYVGPDDIFPYIDSVLFTPSFLSLKRFGMENVFSL